MNSQQIINQVAKEQARKFNWKQFYAKFDLELQKEAKK